MDRQPGGLGGLASLRAPLEFLSVPDVSVEVGEALKRLDCATRFARWRQVNDALAREVVARVLAGAFRNAVGEVLKTTGAPAALPATLFALAKSASSTAGEIRNSALAAGVSTTAYQEFAGAAGKLGSEQEQLGQAFASSPRKPAKFNMRFSKLTKPTRNLCAPGHTTSKR